MDDIVRFTVAPQPEETTERADWIPPRPKPPPGQIGRFDHADAVSLDGVPKMPALSVRGDEQGNFVSSPCQFASDHTGAVSRAPPSMMNNHKNAHISTFY